MALGMGETSFIRERESEFIPRLFIALGSSLGISRSASFTVQQQLKLLIIQISEQNLSGLCHSPFMHGYAPAGKEDTTDLNLGQALGAEMNACKHVGSDNDDKLT